MTSNFKLTAIICLTFLYQSVTYLVSLHPRNFLYSNRNTITAQYATTSKTIENSKVEVSGYPDLESINRNEFSILTTDAYPNKKLIYLDSAASSQKPDKVLNKMDDYYKTSHSNVHRGGLNKHYYQSNQLDFKN